MWLSILVLTLWGLALASAMLLLLEAGALRSTASVALGQTRTDGTGPVLPVGLSAAGWAVAALALPAVTPPALLLIGGLVVPVGMGTVVMARAIELKHRRRQQELDEMQWIIRQRGSVQDQIMRACEREAMERRLRRCQSTLMLTRRGGQDLTSLFHKLESTVAGMADASHDAAALVGAFATHLRHVFMESDRDDIPLGEACEHVARWGRVLRTLGLSRLSISGAPDAASPYLERRIPALLLLGATERLGVAALEAGPDTSLEWRWSISEETARLEAHDGGALCLPDAEFRDWDAAFMLRHGGIAHAGGAWTFELPLLPG